MSSDKLRKLASLLREEAKQYEQQKLIKTAQIIQGTIGLTLLNKKLGRN